MEESCCETSSVITLHRAALAQGSVWQSDTGLIRREEPAPLNTQNLMEGGSWITHTHARTHIWT